MLKKYLKFSIFALFSIILFSCEQKEAITKPNIVFVIADQFRSMEMGCYGGTGVKTPNFDKLASEGVRFKHAISTAPICSPYRAMMLTGNYPVKNGMVTNDHFMKNPTPYFAEACKAAGYKTAYVGKWHIDGYSRTGYIPKDRRHGFDYWKVLECTHNYNSSSYYSQDEKTPRKWKGYDSVDQTRDACEYIKKQSGDEPFCLFLSWGPPHNPYYAPKKYMDQIKLKDIKLRKNVSDFPAAEKMYKESNFILGGSYPKSRSVRLPFMLDKNNVEIRNWYKGYYAAIATLDDLFGQVIKTLKENGKLDNTIIVFTSDHGDNLGSHRQHEKELPYEESISVPLIIRYPSKIKAGIETDALLSPIDIMPTLLSLANIPCPLVDGKDLSGAAEGKNENIRDAVLIMKASWLGSIYATSGAGPWRGVRTKDYTYARKSDTKKPWLLFDNNKDPYQLNNLVDSVRYADLVLKLDEKTNEMLIEANDPEDPVFFSKLIQEERKQHGFMEEKSGTFPTYVKPGSPFTKYLKNQKQ